MQAPGLESKLKSLSTELDGDLRLDELHRVLYATDASVYREMPLGVVYPKNKNDLQKLVRFAGQNGISMIPRAAGTSLAGQCVGTGLVVDVSRYMNRILELNVEEGWVRVEPGVIRDELNQYLRPHGLFFGPVTSTSNRAMIGGMVGNNSCGTTSIKYGTTRDHLLDLEAVLSDGTLCRFGPLSKEATLAKGKLATLEGRVYRQIKEALSGEETQEEIRRHFPRQDIHRRNTGYSVDVLLQSAVFSENTEPFNLAKLLAGSEGTLAFFTEIRIQLDPLPPPCELLVCAHFSSLRECLEATVAAMAHAPYGCELMDRAIMDCTRENREQRKNRFFLEGDPAAILIIELRAETEAELEKRANKLVNDLEARGMGYAFPRVRQPFTSRVWALRAAGFGVLSNMKGAEKPVEFVEDTAVALADLPAYIMEFESLIRSFGQEAIYYAHAGAGELHIRPKVNLKTAEGVRQFREIGQASALLVKKYRGSLSGEHGDGRVRAEFIPLVLGEKNYQLFREIKSTWDPQNIFNPGKIVDAPLMNTSLRYEQDGPSREPDTFMDFTTSGGILKLAEKCNGSGDCRKLAGVSGGTMCPSYMATREEKDSTRARANTLREYLTRPPGGKDPFLSEAVREVLDLCLSCKGCASECPSNVDMAALKAEFMYQYQKHNGTPLRTRFFARYADLTRLGRQFPGLANWMLRQPAVAGLIKKGFGIHPERSLPALSGYDLRKWYERHRKDLEPEKPLQEVVLFLDEFTVANEAELGRKAILLLSRLGFRVLLADHAESGRAALSKGVLEHARHVAEKNVQVLRELVSPGRPLIGLEPSAILSFRDEYPRLVRTPFRDASHQLSERSLLIEEFLAGALKEGRIGVEHFQKEKKRVLFHAHCHQKALSNPEDTVWLLGLPPGHEVEVIPSGCCGMAGSFGYEREHFELSRQIGELVLFPSIRRENPETVICANGTSCRHQIRDGTGRVALHPVEILFQALNPSE